MAKRIRVFREDLFWPKVDRDGPIPAHQPHLGQCWTWTAATHEFGYGIFQNVLAHRFIYQQIHGRALPPDMCVCHHCDNPACVRPSHLFEGTRGQNAADRHAKGRNGNPIRHKGSRHHKAKLTERDVVEIRRRFTAGESRNALAAAFKVCHSSICQILDRTTWRHVA